MLLFFHDLSYKIVEVHFKVGIAAVHIEADCLCIRRLALVQAEKILIIIGDAVFVGVLNPPCLFGSGLVLWPAPHIHLGINQAF